MGGVVVQDWLDRRERYPLELAATAVRASTQQASATVIYNISRHGCGITGEFAIGESVKVQSPSFGELDGQVRWAFMGIAGVEFQQ